MTAPCVRKGDVHVEQEITVGVTPELAFDMKARLLIRRAQVRLPAGRMRRPVSTLQCGSACRLAVKRFALVPAGRPLGDGGAGYPLGRGQVDARPRLVGDSDGDVVLQAPVAGGVVGDAVLPAAPQDADPGAFEGADRALVVVAAGASRGVAVSRPGVPVAGRVGECADRRSEAFVAAVAEAGDLAFARFDGDGTHGSVGGERFGAVVARAAVADLGEQRGGADDALGVAKQRQEDVAVGVAADAVRDLTGPAG